MDRLWIDCGTPHHGIVAESMRKTRTRYHAVIRKACKEADIVNECFAAAISENRNRDFWTKVKRIRCRSSDISCVVDGQSSAAEIAEVFAVKYQ